MGNGLAQHGSNLMRQGGVYVCVESVYMSVCVGQGVCAGPQQGFFSLNVPKLNQ